MTVQILKAGILYFALVFGAGFVLGTIRTLWVVPRVGTRTGELMETPAMLVVIIVASRWVVSHFSPSVRAVRTARNGRHWSRPLAVGGIRGRALGSRLVNQTVLLDPRPGVGRGLLRDACAVCNHAAPRG